MRRRYQELAASGKAIRVVFFQSRAGNEPVRDWLKEALNEEERKVVGADIKTVEYGWPIGMPVCRPMGNGLHEVRSRLPGNRIARVLFCVEDGHMILLHGFIKKTRATSKADLDLAISRKKEIGS